MALQKNDFIEIEYSAKIKDGEVFDSNILEEAKKLNPDIKEVKPVVIAIGSGMLIQGLDKALEGKEINVKYSDEFAPEQAFGTRDPKLVKMIPLKAFTEQKIMPQKGMQFSLDNMVVKVVAVSEGRVLVDFNNPLAGKIVVYDFTIKNKIDNLNEKINALQEFFFRNKFEFKVEEKKIVFKVKEGYDKFIMMFEKLFLDLLGMKIEAEVVKKQA